MYCSFIAAPMRPSPMNALSAPVAFEPAIDPDALDVRAAQLVRDSYARSASLAWARIEARRQLIEEARERNRLESMSLDDLRAERERLYFYGWSQAISGRGNEEMTRLWAKARKCDAE